MVDDKAASEFTSNSEMEVEEEVAEIVDEEVSEEEAPLSVGLSVCIGRVVKECEFAATVGVVGIGKESNCEKGVMVPPKEASWEIDGDSLELKRREKIGGTGSSVPSASTPKMSRTSIELMLSLW